MDENGGYWTPRPIEESFLCAVWQRASSELARRIGAGGAVFPAADDVGDIVSKCEVDPRGEKLFPSGLEPLPNIAEKGGSVLHDRFPHLRVALLFGDIGEGASGGPGNKVQLVKPLPLLLLLKRCDFRLQLLLERRDFRPKLLQLLKLFLELQKTGIGVGNLGHHGSRLGLHPPGVYVVSEALEPILQAPYLPARLEARGF